MTSRGREQAFRVGGGKKKKEEGWPTPEGERKGGGK